jgi:hypothetical protein
VQDVLCLVAAIGFFALAARIVRGGSDRGDGP